VTVNKETKAVLAAINKEMVERRDQVEKIAQFHALEAIKRIADPKGHKESEDVAKEYWKMVEFWNAALVLVQEEGAKR
jgi:hypothetical protein